MNRDKVLEDLGSFLYSDNGINSHKYFRALDSRLLTHIDGSSLLAFSQLRLYDLF